MKGISQSLRDERIVSRGARQGIFLDRENNMSSIDENIGIDKETSDSSVANGKISDGATSGNNRNQESQLTSILRIWFPAS